MTPLADLSAPCLVSVLALLVMACGGGRTGLSTRAQGDASIPDAGTLTCGDASCDNATEYCRSVTGGPPPGIHRETCTALPSGCHACACISTDRTCRCTSTDGLRLSCDVP